MTYTEREKQNAKLIKSLAEHYGYTPKEIGEMTVFQVCALCEEDESNGGTNPGGAKQTMSIAEYRRFIRGNA